MGVVRGDGGDSPLALPFSPHDHMSIKSENWIRRMKEGIAQVTFFETDEECQTSYKDRNGLYQGQAGVTLPKT